MSRIPGRTALALVAASALASAGALVAVASGASAAENTVSVTCTDTPTAPPAIYLGAAVEPQVLSGDTLTVNYTNCLWIRTIPGRTSLITSLTPGESSGSNLPASSGTVQLSVTSTVAEAGTLLLFSSVQVNPTSTYTYVLQGTTPPEPEPEPTVTPTPDPTPDPTVDPTPDPTVEPTPDPTVEPTPDPTVEPTPDPTVTPDPDPTVTPTPEPTGSVTPGIPVTPGSGGSSEPAADAGHSEPVATTRPTAEPTRSTDPTPETTRTPDKVFTPANGDTNPPAPVTVSRNITLVSQTAADHTSTAKPAKASKVLTKATQVKAVDGRNVQPVLTGLPGNTKVETFIVVNGTRVPLANLTSDSSGRLTLPALRFDKAGSYNVGSIAPDGTIFWLKIRVR